MRYWLVKSDPEEYSLADLQREGVTAWTGVRNFQARNYLTEMCKGDQVIVYHSGTERAAVGLARVVRTAYPDPTANEEGWVCVDLVFEQQFKQSVTLAQIKDIPKLSTMLLLRQSRLSVMPLTQEQYNIVKNIGMQHARSNQSTAVLRRHRKAR